MHHDRLRPCNDRFIPFWVRRERQKILDSDETLPYVDEEDIDLTPITTAEREAECSDKHDTQSKSVEDTPTPTSLTATSQPTHSRRGRVIIKPRKYQDYE